MVRNDEGIFLNGRRIFLRRLCKGGIARGGGRMREGFGGRIIR